MYSLMTCMGSESWRCGDVENVNEKNGAVMYVLFVFRSFVSNNPPMNLQAPLIPKI